MLAVVADTSPLNYLLLIGHIDVLPQMYGAVVIPPEVRDELLSTDAPLVVRAWAEELPVWVEVRSADASLLNDPRLATLHPGECAAIRLASILRPHILLIDERAGSAIARGMGLPVTGTLGVLDEAARRKLISLPGAIERLSHTSFRYPRSVVARLIEEDAERT